MQIRKRKGERGSPCRIFLEGLIRPLGSTLTKIEYNIGVTQSNRRVVNLSLKPNFRIIACKKKKSTPHDHTLYSYQTLGPYNLHHISF